MTKAYLLNATLQRGPTARILVLAAHAALPTIMSTLALRAGVTTTLVELSRRLCVDGIIQVLSWCLRVDGISPVFFGRVVFFFPPTSFYQFYNLFETTERFGTAALYAIAIMKDNVIMEQSRTLDSVLLAYFPPIKAFKTENLCELQSKRT